MEKINQMEEVMNNIIEQLLNKTIKVYEEYNYTFTFKEITWKSVDSKRIYGNAILNNRWEEGDEDYTSFKITFDEEGYYHIEGEYITFDYYGKI